MSRKVDPINTWVVLSPEMKADDDLERQGIVLSRPTKSVVTDRPGIVVKRGPVPLPYVPRTNMGLTGANVIPSNKVPDPPTPDSPFPEVFNYYSSFIGVALAKLNGNLYGLSLNLFFYESAQRLNPDPVPFSEFRDNPVLLNDMDLLVESLQKELGAEAMSWPLAGDGSGGNYRTWLIQPPIGGETPYQGQVTFFCDQVMDPSELAGLPVGTYDFVVNFALQLWNADAPRIAAPRVMDGGSSSSSSTFITPPPPEGGTTPFFV